VDRTAVLERLARLIAACDSRNGLAERLCEAGTLLVGGHGSSISINNGDTDDRVTLAATDQLAAQLEDLQDVLGEGPCREVCRRGEPVVTDLDDAVSTLWPEFTRSAAETAGDVTIYCFPMRSIGRLLGVYSVYTYDVLREPGDVVQFLADAIGAAVLRDISTPEPNRILAARTVVYQATGMVSVQLALSPEDALAMLRAHAFAHDTTLEAIAQQVVDRHLDFREIP
jgi:hypothetical protein